GESLYGSVFLSAGTNGWVVAEPGRYGVSMALSLGDDQVVSSQELQFTVLAPPQAVRAEAERLAQDYFSDGVGRALAFGGSRALPKANDALRDVAARFPDRNAARHAEVAVNLPESGEYKLVEFDARGQGKLNLQKPTAAGVQGAKKALVDNAAATVETMGHIAYKEQMDQFSQKAASQGDTNTAVAAQRAMLAVLDKRGVRLPGAVQQEVSKKLKEFGG
ncbi:MAG: hypothetical protein GY856_22330, partial [bacterium]|nr:hypothetical protein [bacterium]